MRVVRRTYTAEGFGTGELWLRDEVLLHHELCIASAQGDMARDRVDATRDRSRLAERLCGRFRAHFRGEPVAYDDVELDLTWCSPFERSVAEALRGVRWGEVVSYGDLATLAGHPRAARAAGAFCAGNRFMLVLPCHRVVAAQGIGGYGASGVDAKRRLLRLEGVEL